LQPAAPAAAAVTCASAPNFLSDDPALTGLLARAAEALADYPSLRSVLDTSGLEVCLSFDLFEALGYFEPESNRIVVDAGIDPDLQLVILIHELRHAEQAARGICPDLSLSRQNYARAVWAMEADAFTVSLVVAWDLRRSGEEGPWVALAATPRYADITGAFATVMLETQEVAAASEAAFEAWYANEERVERYYLSSCSAYLDELDATHQLPRYGALDPDFYASLCVLPDGTSFACAEPDLSPR
jgi:hypothetical protein